jgi:hypothetical protein
MWKDGTNPELVTDVFKALSTMPWYGNVEGFSNMDPVSTLATYVTRGWFSDVHVNQCLDLLRRTLMVDPTKAKAEIENLAFMHKLKEAHSCWGTEQYEQSRTFHRLRHLGQAAATGEWDELGIIINIRNNHWVAVVIDFRRSQILYGDPLGHPPEAESMEILEWWTHHHTGRTFTWNTLPSSRQMWVSFDCQAFELCRIGDFNLSHKSLSGYEACNKLCDLKSTDPSFYEELLAGSDHVEKVEAAQEDDQNVISFEDDSDLPCKAVIASVLGRPLPMKLASTAHGDLVSAAQAESLEDSSTSTSASIKEARKEPEELGVGKRKRRANVMYNSKQFWRHMDGDQSDDERYL